MCKQEILIMKFYCHASNFGVWNGKKNPGQQSKNEWEEKQKPTQFCYNTKTDTPQPNRKPINEQICVKTEVLVEKFESLRTFTLLTNELRDVKCFSDITKNLNRQVLYRSFRSFLSLRFFFFNLSFFLSFLQAYTLQNNLIIFSGDENFCRNLWRKWWGSAGKRKNRYHSMWFCGM